MGEDDTIDFESLKQTLVFWNIDDYPIPVDTTDDLDPVFGDMSKALDLMGFRRMSAWLYSERLNYDKTDLCDAEVLYTYLPEGKTNSVTLYKVPAITLYMIRYAANIGPGPVNLWVIAKPKRELHRVLQCLKSRRHNVLIVKPPPPDEEFLFSVESLLENTRLLGGGKPRFKELYRHWALEYDSSVERFVEIKEDVSKTVDFSERIPTVKGARTAVFWDAVDCPFPPCSTPDEIYRSIASALVAKGLSAKITIWAYLDDCDQKGDVLLGGDKTWASRIYFLPAGDKTSRRIRMLNDMFLWERDSRRFTGSYDASLVLFADDFKGDAYYTDMLHKLHDMRHDLIFVTPTPDINKPETPHWPALLLDKGASWFTDVTDDAEPESEKLPITSDMDYSGFGDQTSQCSEDAEAEEMQTEDMDQSPRRECPLASRVEEGPAWKNGGVEETPEDCILYRWNPVIQMYSLKCLFPKMHQAAKEETPEELPIRL